MNIDPRNGIAPRPLPKEYRQPKKKNDWEYDWTADPKQFKVNGHIPPNRCFSCGFRFLGSQYSAFCNICDLAMTPDPDAAMFIVTERPPKPVKGQQTPEDAGKGYWTTRRKYVSTRIRIPEDVDTEEQYKNKLKSLEDPRPEPLFPPKFTRAIDLAQ